MSSDSPIHPATPPPATPSPQPAPAAPPPVAAPVATAYLPVVERKSAALAGFLSMFPGLGHLYLGLYQRAFAFGGAFIVFVTLTSHGRGGPFFGLLIAFVWFFGLIDAVRQAHAINRGQLAEAGIAPSPQIAKAHESTAALTWGVILVGLGGLWLIDRYVDMEGFWDLMNRGGWPASFILLGLILIITHVKRKRAEHDRGIGMPPRSS
jgi:hypothetical protein